MAKRAKTKARVTILPVSLSLRAMLIQDGSALCSETKCVHSRHTHVYTQMFKNVNKVVNEISVQTHALHVKLNFKMHMDALTIQAEIVNLSHIHQLSKSMQEQATFSHSNKYNASSLQSARYPLLEPS